MKKQTNKFLAMLMAVLMLMQMSAVCVSASATTLENHATGKKIWALWNWRDAENFNDGNYSTYAGGGAHSVGAGWNICMDLAEADGSVPTYNKVKVFYRQYNTMQAAVWTDNALSGELPEVYAGSNVRVNLTNANLRAKVSFDPARVETSEAHGQYDPELALPFENAVTHRYLTFQNAFGATGSVYPPQIAEFEICYATPASIAINAEESYVMNRGNSFDISADILDADGDKILDKALTGVSYSVTAGSEYVTVDSESGTVTVGEFSEDSVTVTVKAVSTVAGYETVCAEKTITLYQSPVSYIEIADLPDFVDVSKMSYGYVTYMPKANVYSPTGSIVTDESLTGVTWSLKEATDGVSLNQETGAVTVSSDTTAKSVTLVAESTYLSGTIAEKTVYFTPKSLITKVWTINGYGGYTTPYAIDANPDTVWNAGNHASHNIFLKAGGDNGAKFNRISIDFDTTYALDILRVAASNKLYSKNAGNAEVPEPEANNGYVPWDANTPLVSGSASVGDASTNLYDLIVNSSVNGDSFDITLDEPVNKKYLQVFFAKDSTYPRYTQTARDINVYYTEEAFAKLNIPSEPVARTSGSNSTIELDAGVYNNLGELMAESNGKLSLEVVSTNGDVSIEGNVLTVGSSTENSLSMIRCTYEADNFVSVSDAYLKTDSESISFGHSVAEIEEIGFGDYSTYTLEDGSEYIFLPSGTAVSEFESKVTSIGAIDFAYSAEALTKGCQITITSEITGETLKVINVINEDGYTGALKFKPNIDSTAYSASAELIFPLGRSVTVAVAEYLENSTSELTQVSAQDYKNINGYQKVETSLTLSNKNAVTKALLYDSETIAPLCPARTKNYNRQIAVVRLDDLNITNYHVYAPEVEWLKERGVVCTLALVGKGLSDEYGYTEDVTNKFADFVKYCDANGYELFNHGYTSAGNEFYGASYESQYEALKKTQDLAYEKCGITLKSFGPPSNAMDATTIQVISDNFSEDIRLIHPTGLTYPKGMTVPNGMFCKNESATGVTEYDLFVSNYESRFTDSEYFWTLVHPNAWNTGKNSQAEFRKIIEFLIDKNVMFMTPSQFYEYMSE